MSFIRRCCVPGCKESGETNLPLHRFPNPELEKDRFNTWLYAIGGDILGLKNEFIFKHCRVCRKHFEVKFLCRNSRLSNIAIPTLYMPDLKSPLKHSYGVRKPMREIQNCALKPCNVTGLYMDSFPDMQPMPSTSKLPAVNEYTTEPSEPMPSRSTPSAVDEHSITELNLSIQCTNTQSPAERTHDQNVTPMDQSGRTHKATEGIIGKKATCKIIQRRYNKLYLTRAESELRKQIIAAKIKICKYKNKIRRQAAEIKAAKIITTNTALLNIIEKCSAMGKLLIQMQWRENKKMVKGRRFSIQEKIASLSIMKQSPKAYRFLRKVFILPAPQTLIKLIQRSNIQPGINKNLFTQLKKKTENMKPHEKLCVLLFDEMSIKPHITYYKRKDLITGFVNNGEKQFPDFANHALVFFIRGLVYNYKQAVAYTFANNSTKGPELLRQIKCVVTNLQEAGFVVVASICDQGTNNRQAIKLLQDETKGIYLRRGEAPQDKILLINNQEMLHIYDPPHLLKGIRNNLITKKLKYSQNGITKIANWSHLELLLKENPIFEGIRLIPKLTENHVKPEKINKMKVKFASQIFSRSVSSNMGYLADKGIIPGDCKNTASLLLFMDNVFDSLNGSYRKNGNAKPLLKPVTPASLHHRIWAEAIQVFKSMKFITTSGKEETVPSIQNWVWTLESIKILLQKINTKFGVNSVWMRHLNQDPLENFFGSIRSHGCRNNNPTCDQFQAAFATLLINNLTSVYTHGKNCERDYCEALHALVIDDNCESPTSTNFIDLASILSINCPTIEDIQNDPRKIAPLQYVSGYFLKNVKQKVFKTCDYCYEIFVNKDPIEYIQCREYAGRRWLHSPSHQFIEIIANFQHIANIILKQNLEKSDIKNNITTAILAITDCNFINCAQHKSRVLKYLVDFVINFTILLHCKNMNKILAGRMDNYDDEDIYQNKAKKMFYKCFKRKR